MKVLLINPNRYKSPPVPPIGLEYVAASLEEKGHSADILDLCFSEGVYQDIDNAVKSFGPDITGITVRNVDSVLYHTNEFFLDEIKTIIDHIKSHHGLKAIIGGTGVSTNPEGTLGYLNADFAVAGPAENTVHEVLNEIRNPENRKKVFSGKYAANSSCTRNPFKTDYKSTLGYADFGSHKGCSSSCVIIEAIHEYRSKHPEDVIQEIRVRGQDTITSISVIRIQ
jgi:radical SAM superfamily enzyme YgiQ (UPF0313 family)